MRIIAGDYKGRRLYTPLNDNIRPTTDKVKEAVFSIVQGYLEDAVCVDLFSGSGNLGLEALSRGAKHCYFCDSSRESLALTKKNVEYCCAQDKSTILQGDYSRAISVIAESEKGADIIFLDPPYKKGLMLDCLERIAESGLLSEDGIIVAEHGIEEELPEAVSGFEKIKERKYGKIVVTLYGFNG